MSRDDAKRVEDIFEAIETITLAEGVMTSHGDDRNTAVCIDAITYRVFTIGEAAKELSPEAKDAHPNVPWSNIAKMRDLIGHHYYRRDPEIIFASPPGVPKYAHGARSWVGSGPVIEDVNPR